MARAARKPRTPTPKALRVKETPLHIQMATFMRAALPAPVFVFHTPNGENRALNVARKLKAMGVVPGVADVALLLPNGRIGWIEVKTPDGVASADQIAFRQSCMALGHPYVVVRSLPELAEVLERWLAKFGLSLKARVMA